MRATKEEVIQMIQQLPDDVTVDDIFLNSTSSFKWTRGLGNWMRAKAFHIRRSRSECRSGFPNNDPNLRERIYGNYRIVYRLKHDGAEIAAICHGAQPLEKVL